MTSVTTGLERLLHNPPASLKSRRLGLLTNPSSIDQQMRSAVDLIAAHPDLNLVALFGPEHGVRGEAQAGDHVEGGNDAATGLPVHSLYGDTRTPTADMLDDIEVLLIDLQDIGVRYATYFASIAYAMNACAEHGRDIVILDRPNPLGGMAVAGNRLDPTFASFVGVAGLSILHGLTNGEFARYWAREANLPEPTVIAMEGWQRADLYDQTGLPWVFPSPNLPTLDSVIAYPATCLIEGTNLSEGRGTTRPFEVLGAPWIQPESLARELTALDLPGVAWRPLWFTPSFSKNAGVACGGVQIYVTDRHGWEPVTTGVSLLATLRRLYDELEWVTFAEGGIFIDLLAGTSDLRATIDANAGVNALLAAWKQDATAFADYRQQFLIAEYGDQKAKVLA